jgi:hypothetical protein
MTQWRINITPAEALVLAVATILVVAVTVEAAKGALTFRAGALLFALAALAEAAALLHAVAW